MAGVVQGLCFLLRQSSTPAISEMLERRARVVLISTVRQRISADVEAIVEMRSMTLRETCRRTITLPVMLRGSIVKAA